MILLMVVIPNPKRGALEASTAIAIDEVDRNRSSYIQDLKYVFKKYASNKFRNRSVVSGQCAQAHPDIVVCACPLEYYCLLHFVESLLQSACIGKI